ncbi:MAG: gamma-glutamyltransferase family protein [Betaproteobacteria bacterium]|nr:gamma-glutamyltransferase family protein [Betaproteobacteria bacterium]
MGRIYCKLPMSRRAYRILPTDATTFHPRWLGTRGAVAGNSNLSVNAGAEILKAGGNAFDAAVAATFVEGLVNPQMHTIGGECPLLVRLAGEARVIAVNGNMAAPARATPAAFRARGLTDVPDSGILAAGVPAAFGALMTVLTRWGTMPLSEVIAPALELAKNGFPVSEGLRNQHKYGIAAMQPRFEKEWPGSAQLYLPGGRVPEVGDRFRNPALARTLEYLGHAKDPLAAFYQGEVAAEIAKFSKERDGLLAREDLAAFETRIEASASVQLGDTELFKTGFWSQGPAELQTLGILWQFDLKSIGFGTPDYCHLLIEAMKLAYADREQYYGDPAMIKVPGEVLLADAYAKQRAGLIDMQTANRELRPGDAWRNAALLPAGEKLTPKDWGAGTVHVDAVDAKGNMASFTPSGAWISSAEVIPALGFPLSVRMMTFCLGPENHPNIVAPGKRPRTTLTPSMAFRNGKPWMAFGSMGGDNQGQWLLQFYLCRAVFGMSIPEAIEAPRLSSEHTPGFFAPHASEPNRVRIEPRFGKGVLDELRCRGHDLDIAPDWSEGFVSCAAFDEDSGLIEAGCDPRGAKSECFPAFALAW